MRVEELESYALRKEYINLLIRRGIEALNPVQEEAVRSGLFSSLNIVVSAPTASGKTLIGEMGIVKAVQEGGKGVYLLPLRALANEKYDEFKALEELGIKVGISTGDYDSPAEDLEDKDVVIATYERFDSLLRIKPLWLRKVSTVVVDELHMINDPERGPVVEMIIARLRSLSARVIGLSATIGNPKELAEWLGAKLVDVAWRPVKLREGYYDKRAGNIIFADGGSEDVEDEFDDRTLNLVSQSLSKGIQVLVFVHNRRRVEELAETTAALIGVSKSRGLTSEVVERLSESPSRMEREKLLALMEKGVGYHHAGLSIQARRAVEEAFRARALSVVFATPTLAAGVNLPARRVIVSIKRYDPTSSKMVNIPVFEYKQMAGRAGRPRYDEIGEAIIADAKSEKEALKYINSGPENIVSKVSSERSLRIHTLSLIAGGDAGDLKKVMDVYSQTLGARQYGGIEVFSNQVERAIRALVEMRMVEWYEGGLRATRLGKLTSFTYLDPLTVHYCIKYRPGDFDELDVLHLITTSVDYVRSRPYIPDSVVEVFEDEALNSSLARRIGLGRMSSVEIDNLITGYVHALALRDWINEVDEDRIASKYEIGPGDLYTMRETVAWIAGSLAKIERLLGNITFSTRLNRLSLRVQYGVKEDALELIRLRGIGRVRARILINHGIKTLQDLAKTPRSKLLSLPGFGVRLVESIYEELKGMGFKVEG
ncbi:MAG: DEAD/DEAH box helicase [Thermogladius sp.]